MSPPPSSTWNSRYPMPPRNADLETTWRFLEDGIDHIMKALQTNESYAEYMNLYTVVFNYCTSLQRNASGQIISKAEMGLNMYNKLTKYFAQHLRDVHEGAENLVDEDLLRYYAKERDRYITGAKYVDRLLGYFNRHFVLVEKRKGVYTVYTLALVQWKLGVFNHIQNKDVKLAGAVVSQIEKQRNGDTIDESLVKSVVDSFFFVGIDESNTNKQSLDVYTNRIEQPFIMAIEKYYRTKFESLFAENSISDSVKKGLEWLKDEEGRVERYLHTSSRKALSITFGRVLVEPILEEFQASLDFDKDEKLQRIFVPLSQIAEALEPLQEKFEKHVKKSGLAAVERLVNISDGDTEETIEPKDYISALIEVHNKYSGTVQRCFKREKGFVASLDKACRKFVNWNAVTNNSSSRSSELLVKQVDSLLCRNNNESRDDLESALKQVMVIFKYIEDKDVFQKIYTNRLAKRLIHGASASDEAESSMILKLKEVCGSEYTQKSERMFTDMRISKDLTDCFKMSIRHPDDDLTFAIQVFGTNIWPLKSLNMNFVVPKDIFPTYNRFQQYYQQKHSGRRLTWLWAYSKNELRSNYTNQKYIFMTSSFQMAVLVQYNDYDSLTLDELQTNTGIPEDLLKQVLAILCKARVLLNDAEGEPYDLNPNFKNKKIKVNLNQPIRVAEKAEMTEVLESVDEDRKLAIQATIVRIMKAQKTMENQALIQEVISHISTRFTPKVLDIKKAIDALLEKEYIERVEGTRNTFAYVA